MPPDPPEGCRTCSKNFCCVREKSVKSQMIPDHGNCQKRRASFKSYLLEFERVKCKIFY